MKYFFISIVHTTDSDDVTSQMLGYDSLREAEIKFHDEVSYGLKLDNIKVAHFQVINEYGMLQNGLTRTIATENAPL